MVSTAQDNLLPDGGDLLRTTFDDTSLLTSKVATNLERKSKATFYCNSPQQDGTFTIYDVDPAGVVFAVNEISVTAGTAEVYSHNHIMWGAYCTFEPDASNGDGSDQIIVRVIFGRS